MVQCAHCLAHGAFCGRFCVGPFGPPPNALPPPLPAVVSIENDHLIYLSLLRAFHVGTGAYRFGPSWFEPAAATDRR